MTQDSGQSTQARRPIPRLPVLGWDTFSGKKASPIPCIANAPNVAFTNSGRAAIYQALKILSVGQNDSVLVPTYHCPTMISPAVALGAEPIFYPIDQRGGIGIAALDRYVKSSTKAIIAPHYFGIPQPMAQLRSWCDETGIALIEDCAHALFGRAGERDIGQWGDLAIASLTKFLPVPEGGCLVCNTTSSMPPILNPTSLASEIKRAVDMLEEGARHSALPGLNNLLRSIFWLKGALRAGPRALKANDASLREIDVPGAYEFNHRLADNSLSAVCRWLPKHAALERIVMDRRRNYVQLVTSLSGHAGFRPLIAPLPEGCAPYVFPLWVNNPDPAYQELRARKIPVFRWDRLWPDTPEIQDDHGINWSHHVFQLGCHQDLRPEEIDRIVSNVIELCK